MLNETELKWLGDLNTEYRAAFHVLTSEAFAADARVWGHVHLYGIDFPTILADETWCRDEYELLTIAASLFNGGGSPNLNTAFATLSSDWTELAIEAIRIRAGLAGLRTYRVMADGVPAGTERGRSRLHAHTLATCRPDLRGKSIALERIDAEPDTTPTTQPRPSTDS